MDTAITRRETDRYVLGHTGDELVRLERQAAFVAAPTEELLRRAGLRSGMSVLDIGCGVGDVSIIAARLVGPTGSVTGIDRSADALATARLRAETLGLPGIVFEQSDINVYIGGGTGLFDAIVGRFIIMHLPEASDILRRLMTRLRPDGTMAFIEMDIGSAAVVPEIELFTRCINWIITTYRRAGMEPDMGSRLYRTLRAAGLSASVAGTLQVEAGPTTSAHEFIAGTVRSLLPYMLKLNVAKADEIGIDTLSDRLRAAALAGEHCFIYPRLIGAWAKRES